MVDRHGTGYSAGVEIDDVVVTFYGAFDNRDGRVPDGGAFAMLFLPGATIAHRDGARLRFSSPADFFAPRLAMLTDGRLVDFHEWEVDAVTTVHVGIASRTSSY